MPVTQSTEKKSPWRHTSQDLAPIQHQPTPAGQYDLYPAFPVEPGAIEIGYEAIAKYVAEQGQVRIDGYVGIFWETFREKLEEELTSRGLTARWVDVSQALKPPNEIESLVQPFLGGDDPLFGTRFTGNLADFFDSSALGKLAEEVGQSLMIFYGCGAGLVELEGPLVYIDLPKNELQFRSRAKTVTNLATVEQLAAKATYKRFYFVDWVALNRHKQKVISEVDLFIDGQRPEEPTLLSGEVVRKSLQQMSQNFFRVRPWFEPGPWGGQWIKEKMPQLPQDVPNYAWSFELIVPENGLMLSDAEHLLEISFDWLMYFDNEAILGNCAKRFGYEFPIRFDFLDTFDGGNLSVQCHPRPEYTLKHFGETFTQDETYYILDSGENAEVYLGFQEGVDPDDFRKALEKSWQTGCEVDIKKFVRTLPANKHDLFLIPNGTIHCSGIDSLVLEISATPYIFTFKMYDWLRMDLEGNPRPLNIDRAFENLYFDRQGDYVQERLVSHPQVLKETDTERVVHVPTHEEHFYDVRRLEFDNQIECQTDGSPQVMSLVEGTSLTLETSSGMRAQFNYAETFVVPAATTSFRLINESAGRAKVIQSFIKNGAY